MGRCEERVVNSEFGIQNSERSGVWEVLLCGESGIMNYEWRIKRKASLRGAERRGNPWKIQNSEFGIQSEVIGKFSCMGERELWMMNEELRGRRHCEERSDVAIHEKFRIQIYIIFEIYDIINYYFLLR